MKQKEGNNFFLNRKLPFLDLLFILAKQCVRIIEQTEELKEIFSI